MTRVAGSKETGGRFASMLQEQVDKGGVVCSGAKRRTGSEQKKKLYSQTETREAQPPTRFLLLLHPSITRILPYEAGSLFSDVLGGGVSLPAVV